MYILMNPLKILYQSIFGFTYSILSSLVGIYQHDRHELSALSALQRALESVSL